MDYAQMLRGQLDQLEKSYFDREWKAAYWKICARQKLGAWREEDAPCPETSVDRISWLIDGSYGADLAIYSRNMVVNILRGKTGKTLEKAMISAGRELTILVALFDTTEYTARKITEVWKKQGADFPALNFRAAVELRGWLESEFN